MKKYRGYVALISVLTCSALLLSLVLALSSDLYLARLQLTEERNYRTSRMAAYTCAQLAFRGLSSDPDRFLGGVPVEIFLSGDEKCTILGASTTETGAGAAVTGMVGQSFVRLYSEGVRVSPSTSFVLKRWKEY